MILCLTKTSGTVVGMGLMNPKLCQVIVSMNVEHTTNRVSSMSNKPTYYSHKPNDVRFLVFILDSLFVTLGPLSFLAIIMLTQNLS